MPTGLETDGSRVTFVAVRGHGWHQLGTLVDHDIGVSDALKLAHLSDLDYQLVPAFADLGTPGAGMVRAPGSVASVRRNPFDRKSWDVLGIGMSDNYVLHTPEEAFAFGEQIIEQGHPLAAMGSVAGGRRAFAAFRLEGVTVGNQDKVNAFLNVMTSFDGTLATFVRASYIRVICENMFNDVLRERGIPTYKARHVGGPLTQQVHDARAALDFGKKGMTEFTREADRWLARTVTLREFDMVERELIKEPRGATPKQRANTSDRRETFRKLYESSFTNQAITGSAWGVMHAWTEYVDWIGGTYPTREARVAAQVNHGSTLESRRDDGVRTIARVLSLTKAG
jgi:phage/plasmid-like protein (TIGR03299 family)